MAKNAPFSGSKADHQSIKDATSKLYTFFEKVHREYQNTDKTPPLELISYAIRDMMYPTFISPSRAPDLLDLIATAESYRMRAVEKADTAREFNNYYSTRRATEIDILTAEELDVVLLTEEEQIILDKVIANAPETRQKYVDLVLGYCQLDIYHLCTTCSEDIGPRMEKYFGNESFIHNPEEGRQFAMAAKKITLMMHDWAVVQNSGVGGVRNRPCPVEVEGLLSATEVYLQHVEEQIQSLEAIFPTP
ncbi:hypothetical protein Moror_1505 [Moniliophthora roreri MCA 2997]|uniref:Uncharacterized protein n=1 Tax=Moniliophthora roreri (strain MCA 2997) TaxID=1381753 RepID=V2X3J5_MONRO|nr:hypothetical protein Moror_1505 [Moniliophthora roreri MCA 2997]